MAEWLRTVNPAHWKHSRFESYPTHQLKNLHSPINGANMRAPVGCDGRMQVSKTLRTRFESAHRVPSWCSLVDNMLKGFRPLRRRQKMENEDREKVKGWVSRLVDLVIDWLLWRKRKS